MDTKPKIAITPPELSPPPGTAHPPAPRVLGAGGRSTRPALALLLLLLAGSCVLPAAAAVDTPAPLTLDETLRIATSQAPQVAAAAATIAGTEALAPAATELPDPELIAGIDSLPVEGHDSFSPDRDAMTMQRIGFMQRFPGRGKRQLRGDRAMREIEVARAQWRAQRFDAGRAALQAWVERARAEAARSALQDLRPALQLQAEISRTALASGRTTAADALASASAAALLDERLLALQQESQVATAGLARWVGAEALRPPAPLPEAMPLPPPGSLDQTLADHAPLALTRARIEEARAEVALARAEKRPDWSAELSYGRRGTAYDDMVSVQFRIGLPLFTARRQDPVIAARMAAVRAGEAEHDAALRMHRAEIDAAIATWRQGQERLRLYATELLPLARERRELALAAYGSGRGELRAALDAVAAEIDTRLARIDLQAAVVNAWGFLYLLHETEEQP